MAMNTNMFFLSITVIALTAFSEPINTILTLDDGSTVKGEFLSNEINGSTIFAEKLSLSPSLVRDIKVVDTNGNAKIELANNDLFSILIIDKSYAFKSKIGNFDIPVCSLKELKLSAPRENGANNDEIVFRENGPIIVEAHHTSKQYSIPAGTLGRKGRFEFTGTILTDNQTFGWDGSPTFFKLQIPGGGWSDLTITANNGMGKGGICGPILNPRAASKPHFSGRMSYEDVVGPDWQKPHHYILAYNEKGITGIENPIQDNPIVIAIWLDGKIIAQAGWEHYSTNAFSQFETKDMILDFGHNSSVDVKIEDFIISRTDCIIEQ